MNIKQDRREEEMSGHKMAAGSLSGWHYGIVKDIVSGEKTEYEVHNNCKPSRVYGIEGSRIVWLELKQKGEVTARYNKEWIIDPRNKSSERAIDLLLARFE